MRVEQSVEINRPVEEVFAYAADPEHYPEWTSIVLEVHKEKPGPLTEGEKFTTVSKFLGRKFETPFEITSHESPRLHSHKSRGGPLPQEWTFAFEGTADGTRVTELVEGEPGSFFGLAAPLIERAGRRQFRTDLETLKDLLEARG